MGARAQIIEIRADTGEAVLHELRAVRALLASIETRVLGAASSTAPAVAPSSSLSDDAVVDQRSVQAPRDLYLRLARAKAFPSNKIGKRICARWGDVRTALLEGPGLRSVPVQVNHGEAQSDGLDALRSQLGLAQKG